MSLEYAFTSNPYPIRASTAGSAAHNVDLQVMVSAPPGLTRTVKEITIQIPVGDESPGKLSNNLNLPSPQGFDNSLWDITCEGDMVAIAPATGQNGILHTAILFTLPGITVNEQPGVVPITITEGSNDPDSSTYRLTKQPTDFPVTDFHATPAFLDDLDQSVTLYWTGSNQVSYKLDLGNGQFQQFTAADGKNGVPSPKLTQTATFAMEVIKANPDGSYSILDTLPCTVPVNAPYLHPNCYFTPGQIFSGQYVFLHWIAFNADSVSVLVNGKTYDSNAPVDTYENGYPVLIKGNPGQQVLEVIAYSESKNTPFQRQFTVVLTNRICFRIPNDFDFSILPHLIPIPGTNQALAAISAQGKIYNIDVSARQVSCLIPFDLAMASAAVTTDGEYALLPHISKPGVVSALHIPQGQIDAAKELTLPQSGFYWLAAAPHGKWVVAFGEGPKLQRIDVSTNTWQVRPDALQLPGQPMGLDFTTDGKYALVAVNNTIQVVDLDANQIIKVVTVPGTISALKATPDGKLVLVASTKSNQISLLDTATWNVEPSGIPVASPGSAVQISADSKTALVTSGGNNFDVHLIDIPNRRVSQTCSGFYNQAPQSVVILPDYSTMLLLMDEMGGTALLVMCGVYDIPTALSPASWPADFRDPQG